MKNKQKVWIRGVEGRGNEVLNALKAVGGKLKHNNATTGDLPFFIYAIDHRGYIGGVEIISETAKIIMDNYREIKLQKPWARGTVLFSSLLCTFAICSGKEDTQLGNVQASYVFHDNDMDNDCSIDKRYYHVADKNELFIFTDLLHSLGYDFDFKTKEVLKWRWKPKEDEKYWVVNSKGFAEPYTWHDDIFNQLRFDFGNCFRTKEEAEVASERMRSALKGGYLWQV